MSVVYDISKIDKGSKIEVSFANEIAVPYEFSMDDNKVFVTFLGYITRIGDEYLLTGNADVKLATICGDCLTPVSTSTNFEVNERLSNKNSDDMDVIIFDGNKIDVHDVMIQNIIANVPIKIVCSDDCKGLCHHCGANLNTTTCECKPPINPAFEGLLALFDENKEV